MATISSSRFSLASAEPNLTFSLCMFLDNGASFFTSSVMISPPSGITAVCRMMLHGRWQCQTFLHQYLQAQRLLLFLLHSILLGRCNRFEDQVDYFKPAFLRIYKFLGSSRLSYDNMKICFPASCPSSFRRLYNRFTVEANCGGSLR